MVFWLVSPAWRRCIVSAKPYSRRRRWQTPVGRELIAQQRSTLQGGYVIDSTTEWNSTREYRLPLAVAKLKKYMALIMMYVNQAGTYSKVCAVPEDLDVLRYIAIQVNNGTMDPEDQLGVVQFCCEMLNEIEVTIEEIREPEHGLRLNREGYIIKIQNFGDVALDQKISVRFRSELPLEAKIEELLQVVPAFPESITLIYSGNPELVEPLQITQINSKAKHLSLQLQSLPKDFRRPCEVYKISLIVTWKGPSAKFPAVRARLYRKMHENFLQIRKITNHLKEALNSKALLAAITHISNLNPNDIEGWKEASYLLTFMDDTYRKALQEYERMSSIKALYIDPEGRNTLTKMEDMASEDKSIVLQLQDLADAVHRCRVLLESSLLRGKQREGVGIYRTKSSG
ncbi:uncharacterized protein LOC111272767 [Varroa jacobsoni]|uniref:Uncharacterized protein n=1 Tax=Varroa destructor TaxID=109461 RepID=A0A7M7J704_VARDE|nr:uncharacterized protein LOC111244660 [Varroa destructor]XP_022710118.1 uncharacterized protein LOC111272767 [Varroa jacobsoni]